MAWTVPDKGEGQNDIQSILFQEYLDALVAGIAGSECVLSGCAVSDAGSPDMTPAVAKGAVLSQGVLFAVAAANVTIGTADATNPRIDLVVVNSSGALAVRAGTAAAAPKPPARSAGDVVLAAVYVPATDTTISNAQITDMRVMRTQGPITIKKQTTAVTFNTTSAIQTYFSVVLPSGLFLAGKTLRVKCGGNYLSSGGTSTWTLTINYGGTTMFADVTAAAANDAVRGAWHVDFVLQAQANNDQALNGNWALTSLAAKTAPTAGIGDIASASIPDAAIGGSAAIDSDLADRTLDVRFTMSVSAAGVETVMEYATAELV